MHSKEMWMYVCVRDHCSPSIRLRGLQYLLEYNKHSHFQHATRRKNIRFIVSHSLGEIF
jgi:hypothetical protein